MNGEIYEDTKIQRDNGSNLYKSEQTGDYLFNIDGWTIAHGGNYTSSKYWTGSDPIFSHIYLLLR